jgi:anthranilate 1,2-dioxygenase small subunit
MHCDGRAMLKDRILAIRETQVYEPRTWRHFISGLRIVSTESDTIRARANFLVTEAMSDQNPAVFVVGRYFDTLVRRNGRLLFKVRIAVCDNHHVRRSLIMPV